MSPDQQPGLSLSPRRVFGSAQRFKEVVVVAGVTEVAVAVVECAFVRGFVELLWISDGNMVVVEMESVVAVESSCQFGKNLSGMPHKTSSQPEALQAT